MSYAASVRVLLGLVGLYSAFALSPLLTGLCILLLTLRYRAYEALAIGLLTDLLWQPVPAVPLFTLGTAIALWALEPLRTEFLL